MTSADQQKAMIEIETIAKNIREKYQYQLLDPDDVVMKFLIERHHWLPKDIRELTVFETLLCLTDID